MAFVWKFAHSEADRLQSFQLRAQEYGRYYSNIPPYSFSDEFDDLRLPTGEYQAETVSVLDDAGEFIGTVRINLVAHPAYPNLPSEAAKIMALHNNLITHLDETLPEPLPPDVRIGEIGRLAVSLNSDRSLTLFYLLRATLDILLERDLDLLIAIMSPVVVHSMRRRLGLNFQPVPCTHLCRDDPDTLRYMVRHYEYFLPMLTQIVPEAQLDEFSSIISYEVLRDLTAEVPDGPSLYWISAADYAATFETLVKEAAHGD